jgi:hypothetical protein
VRIMVLTCLLSWTCLVSHCHWHLLIPWQTSRYATAWSKPGSPSHAPVILVGQCIDHRNRQSAALAGHLNWSLSHQSRSITSGDGSGRKMNQDFLGELPAEERKLLRNLLLILKGRKCLSSSWHDSTVNGEKVREKAESLLPYKRGTFARLPAFQMTATQICSIIEEIIKRTRLALP